MILMTSLWILLLFNETFAMEMSNHECKRIYDPNINAPYSYQTYAVSNVNDSSNSNVKMNSSSITIPSYQSVAALIDTIPLCIANECNESIIATPISSMSFTAAAAVSYSNSILTETSVYSINTSVPMLSIRSISSAHTDEYINPFNVSVQHAQ
eukprot:204786_1